MDTRKFVALILGTLLFSSATAVPTPLLSELWLRADAAVNIDGPADTFSIVRPHAIGQMTGAVSATDVSGTESVSASMRASARWFGPAAGDISYDYVGWTSSARMVNGYVAIGGYWGYTFEANERSTFTLDWNASILTATDPFGLAGFVFYFTSEFATPYEEMHAGTQGSLTRELIAGHRYYVQVAPHANQLGIAVPGDNYLTGQFHWTITPVAVPEPASLSLLGVGLLAIVLLRTREKRARRLRVRSGSVEFD